jgi:pyrimidine-specific ribonucleoside hydrolase
VESDPIPVIADVDTGIDDALALLLLARDPRVELLAVTCVDGNVDVDTVVTNTRHVLATAGRPDVPIGRGAERPLVEPRRHAEAVHGADGLGDLFAREPFTTGHHALDLLRATIAASPRPVTIVALAPLTNLALLLRAFPEVAPRIERIVFMGGSIVGGNATAVAEFNAWHDPEAVDVVLRSGIDTVMYGLDVFSSSRIRPEAIARLEAGDRAAVMAAALLRAVDARNLGDERELGAYLGDGGTACVVADPSLATVRRYPVTMALSGHARGQTIVDTRTVPGEDAEHGIAVDAPAIGVVTAIDVAAMESAFVEALSARSSTRAR